MGVPVSDESRDPGVSGLLKASIGPTASSGVAGKEAGELMSDIGIATRGGIRDKDQNGRT